MELAFKNYKLKVKPKKTGEPRNTREMWLDKIRKVIGNRFVKRNGVYVDSGELWTMKDLQIKFGQNKYRPAIPTEWLSGWYSYIADARTPSSKLFWLLKESKK